jgi:hypothetical protein
MSPIKYIEVEGETIPLHFGIGFLENLCNLYQCKLEDLAERLQGDAFKSLNFTIDVAHQSANYFLEDIDQPAAFTRKAVRRWFDNTGGVTSPLFGEVMQYFTKTVFPSSQAVEPVENAEESPN